MYSICNSPFIYSRYLLKMCLRLRIYMRACMSDCVSRVWACGCVSATCMLTVRVCVYEFFCMKYVYICVGCGFVPVCVCFCLWVCVWFGCMLYVRALSVLWTCCIWLYVLCKSLHAVHVNINIMWLGGDAASWGMETEEKISAKECVWDRKSPEQTQIKQWASFKNHWYNKICS